MQERALVGEKAYYDRLLGACGQKSECRFVSLPEDKPGKLSAMRASFKCIRGLDVKNMRDESTCTRMVTKMQQDYAKYSSVYLKKGQWDETKLAAAHEDYYYGMVAKCPSMVDRCHLAALPEHGEWAAMKAKFACMKTLDLTAVRVGDQCSALLTKMQQYSAHQVQDHGGQKWDKPSTTMPVKHEEWGVSKRLAMMKHILTESLLKKGSVTEHKQQRKSQVPVKFGLPRSGSRTRYHLASY
jgi:hypothetical protein